MRQGFTQCLRHDVEVGMKVKGDSGKWDTKDKKQVMLFNGSGNCQPFAKLALPLPITSHPSVDCLCNLVNKDNHCANSTHKHILF